MGRSFCSRHRRLIYLIVFIFYLVSRNQDQVVSAEKEARKKLERGGAAGGSPSSGNNGTAGKSFGGRGRDLTRPGEENNNNGNGSSGNDDNTTTPVDGNGRKIGFKTSASGNDLYEQDSDGNLRPSQKKRRQAKGLDAAGGGSHLGSSNNNNPAVRAADGTGLPVYSTWSSNSQTPSRAVSENFDHYHEQQIIAGTRQSQGPPPAHSHLQHHQQQNQSQSMFNPPSSVTLNSSATNDSRLGVMSQQGQPTQSRLFYDD